MLAVSVDASAIPDRMGGVGRYVENLVRVYSTLDDLDVSVISRTGDRARWLPDGGTVSAHDIAPRSRVGRIVWEQVRLPGVLDRFGVDVHHGTHYTMPRRSGLPQVVTIHDMSFVDHPEWHQGWKVHFFRDAIAAALRSASVLICVSQTTADRLTAFGRPSGQIRVIPHGVDLKRFTPRPDGDEAVLRRLGLRRPYIGFVGTVEPRKGVADLITAFNRLAPAHPDLSLVVAGQHGWGDEADTALRESRYRDRIVRPGYLSDDDIAPVLRQAAAVAYPSYYEGFGLPVLEAMACGAPVVTTKGTAMAEFSAGAALLVDPGDVAALTGALECLLEGDTGLDQRRRLGLEAAGGQTWEASAARHVAAYRLAAA